MTLRDFFRDHPCVALGFSGGVDSSYLLYAALECGAQVKPFFIKTPFQPQFELEDALSLAKKLGVEVTVLSVDVLTQSHIAANPADRCYHCKRFLFGLLKEQAGDFTLMDGTNASDDVNDRPGMRALQELNVLSPLRLCGLTKSDIRRLSQEAGLPTWNKPAYACLATRIPTETPITASLLRRVESAENALFQLGFTDFRVRVYHDAARVQVPVSQMKKAALDAPLICNALKPYFDAIFLDLEGR